MPLVSFAELMRDAERHKYAVGYFECWNLESLMAAADAAQATRSPVLLGFSGIYLPHPNRAVHEPLSVYAAMGLELCRRMSVPAGLVFNESPHADAVAEAVRLGFTLVMFSDEHMAPHLQMEEVRRATQMAHAAGLASEGEALTLPGVGGELTEAVQDAHLTDPDIAQRFVEHTGVDAFAVNIGQMHLHGRRQVRLDMDRLLELRRRVPVPLVVHGATSVDRDDLRRAAELGIRKVNIGSAIKQAYVSGLRKACTGLSEGYNPYEAVGSGLAVDVMVAGRLAMQSVVEDLMHVFGSAGRA